MNPNIEKNLSKETRAKLAQTHTDEMSKKYEKEIAKAINNTKIYTGGDFKLPEKKDTTERIYGTDSVSAIMHHAKEKTAVLNFASYKHPGGGFLKGALAQEEALCHESFLYNVLSQETSFYGYNNENLNNSLYEDRALYTPKVIFERDQKAVKCDVITCAAPNYKAFIANGGNDEDNSKALAKRLRFIRDICMENKIATIILGAYGCGVFGQDPCEVAGLMHSIFTESTIKNIIYAIPPMANKNNYNAFKYVIFK